jgi:TolB-like protein/tetratricopeptide (TPR) repeat protein
VGGRLTPDDTVSPGAVRQALDRVLGSPEFASAARLSSFLRYVVTETLEGRSASLKGYSIAVDVFDRPADFDQSSDPIVRVEASRLRRALAHYYQESGTGDPVIIVLPRGAYVPAFRRRDVDAKAASDASDGVEASGPETQAASGEEPPGSPPPETARQESRAPSPRWRWIALRAAAAIPVVLAALLIWDITTRRDPAGQQGGSEAVVSSGWSKPQVGFAPFETIYDDEADTHPARGISREMLAEFARFRNLSVYELAPGAALPATGYVISGSIRRSGNDIRATIQARKADGTTIWTETYDRVYTPSTLLAVQDEIARAAAITIAQPYGVIYQHELERVASEPADAIGYVCVLRAGDYWRKLDPATHLVMRGCLEETVKQAPDYADAWQAITHIYLDEYKYGFNARPPSVYEPLQKALEAAERSVSLASTDARSYQSMYSVLFYRGDMEGFKRAGSEAIKLNPNSLEILADFGGKVAFSGAWEEGLPLVRRAMMLNPGHPGWYYVSLVLDAYRRGEYRQALAFIERMNLPNHYRTHLFLAMTYGQLGDRMNAAASIESLLKMDPDFALNARTDLMKWGFESGLVDLCIDGLKKAGLTISGE